MSKTTLVIVDEAYNEITNNPDQNTMTTWVVKRVTTLQFQEPFRKYMVLQDKELGILFHNQRRFSQL